MDKNDFFIKSQIEISLGDITALINTGVFNANILRPFREPVFISIILKLHDLLQKLSTLGKRINFTDDIPEGDITDLISKVRNAICHLNSPENLLDKERQIKFVFNMIIGKCNAMAIGEKVKAKSDYDDDIAFYYGSYSLYFKRHIIRALQDAQGKITELYPPNNTDPHAPIDSF